ncbi:hypothetical protein AVT69_gp288 [Pseudomonas phage PhiPA3]|uniref:Uncharacterized protein 290 n=1 Tax=Pseudomonas phage PhiPA3 TaxID=998086 RepID=F8SJC6_BPPA3|nr:hypothetical protein AVT69_gp288 [Pseudomonas phage PhiPA3]AEH03713.1 hypothetical protein [Pseudomonas phage PhiPA3]
MRLVWKDQSDVMLDSITKLATPIPMDLIPMIRRALEGFEKPYHISITLVLKTDWLNLFARKWNSIPTQRYHLRMEYNTGYVWDTLIDAKGTCTKRAIQ